MNKNLTIVVAVVVLVLAAWGIYRNQNLSTEKQIKIGVLSILSGDAASWGENAKKGIDLAIDEWRAKGEKIEVIYEDTQAEAKQAVTAFQKLVNIDKVDAIIGPLLQLEVAGIVPLLQKNPVPVVAPNATPLANRIDPRNPLLIWMDPTVQAERLAEYVYSEGVRKIAAIGTKDPWETEVTNSFADKFKALGGAVVYQELVASDASDVKSTITQVVSKKPEAVYLGTYWQFINSIKSLRDHAYQGKVYSIEVDQYLAGETKETANGLQFIAPDSYVGEFTEKFEKRYLKKPGIPAGQAYDAANILLQLLTSNGSTEGVLEGMRRIKTYQGTSGTITFTDDHRAITSTGIFELQNGNIVKIK